MDHYAENVLCFRKLAGRSKGFVYEESIVNPKEKTMIVRSKNMSFADYLQVEEICTYKQDAGNNEW